MKSFKQFIYEKQMMDEEVIEESRVRRWLAAGALGASLIAGLQAGGMKHEELPSVATHSQSRETRGGETQTQTSTRQSFAQKGKPTGFKHRGFFDVGDRVVADTAQGIPSQSRSSVTLQGAKGKTETATRHRVGGKTVNKSGNIDKTKFSSDMEENGPIVSGKTDSLKFSGNVPLTKAASPGEQAAGYAGFATGLAGIGRLLRRRR